MLFDLMEKGVWDSSKRNLKSIWKKLDMKKSSFLLRKRIRFCVELLAGWEIIKVRSINGESSSNQ